MISKWIKTMTISSNIVNNIRVQVFRVLSIKEWCLLEKYDRWSRE